MNECDIAETCTGDSSQVCPGRSSCRAPGKAPLIPIGLALWGDCSLAPSAPQLATPAVNEPRFLSPRKGFFMPRGFVQSLDQHSYPGWYSQRLAQCLCTLGIKVDNNINIIKS